MNHNMDAAPSNEEAPFVPFTKAERIKQLGEIDESIVSLLRTAGKAAHSLSTSDPSDGDTAMSDGVEEETSVFKSSVDDFFRTLHSVNVRIKRQIWGLEEAGIVTLAKDDEEEETSKSKIKKVLEPDGDGKIGGLDTGWLNSRSNKVERDMEAELWGKAEVFLSRMLERGNSTNVEGNQMAP